MKREFLLRILCALIIITSCILSGFAGVSRTLQDQYKREYENKAMFLKIPLYAEKQMISISGKNFRVEPGTGAPKYKVGDQLRVLLVDFSGDEIKFRMGGITTTGIVEIGFKFDESLQENFPNRETFDRALQSTLTEGLKYTDIEDAKRGFIQDEFERALKQIASSASAGRDSVLKTITSQIPAYQDAQRENENLKNRIQDVSGQLNQSQSENRKLEAESKHQQSEITRLKSANSALQEKLDNFTSQMSKLGDELRDVKGNTQGYQKELLNLQRSLNLKVDATRDLASQIVELGLAMRKLQKDNESLANQANTLRTNLETQQKTNGRLLGETEELKAGNLKMQNMISALTSKEDSLGKKFFNLRNEKEKLDNFVRSIKALRSQIVEEKTEDGVRSGKVVIYLKSTMLGSLDWSFPNSLGQDENNVAEAVFSAESIDRVQMTPEDRSILTSFGKNLKIRIDLTSGAELMTITPEQKGTSREIGERDHSKWRWNLTNQGAQDAPLALTAFLINKDSNEIPLFHDDHMITTSNLVQQIRGQFKLIPFIAGLVLGCLLFGIISIFRHSKHDGKHLVTNEPGRARFSGKKQL